MKHALRAPLAAVALTTTIAALAGWNTLGAASTTEASAALAGAATVQTNAQTNAAAKVYSVDPVHSNIIFKIRHAGLTNFYGRFNDLSGSVRLDKRNIPGATIEIAVDMGSLDTKNAKRDAHVKGADFFNARQYPKATFTSTSITEGGEGGFELTGDFTLHGQTRPVTATMSPVETGEMQGKAMMGFEARFSIKRSDYGITTYIDTANPEDGSLGDTVEIVVAIEGFSE